MLQRRRRCRDGRCYRDVAQVGRLGGVDDGVDEGVDDDDDEGVDDGVDDGD